MRHVPMAALLVAALLALVDLSDAQITASTPSSDLTPSSHSGVAEAARPPAHSAGTLPDLPAPPRGKAALIGGTIGKVDHLRDEITIDIFGGGRMRILFDPRSHIYRDGLPGSLNDLTKGARVYAETVLDGSNIFARNLRIVTENSLGQASGQILGYSPASGELTLRAVLSPEPVKLRVAPDTVIRHGGRRVSATELRSGSLIAVKFLPSGQARPGVQEISILAEPGTPFTFSGRVATIDLRTGHLVLIDRHDGKEYEISLDSTLASEHPDLREGVAATVTASFDGAGYAAKSLIIDSVPEN
jgi:hypothetical protein